MKKIHLCGSLLLLSVSVTPAYAADDCKPMSAQTQLNHYRLMGIPYLRGPVKSVSMTTERNPQSDIRLSSFNRIHLSPCGHIISYDFMRKNQEYGTLTTTTVTGAEDDTAINLEYTYSTGYITQKKPRPMVSRITLAKDAQQVVTGYRTENFIKGNSTVLSEKGELNYRNGDIDNIVINSELFAQTYTMKYDYNDNGDISRIYTGTSPMIEYTFTYNDKGGLVTGSDKTDIAGITVTNHIECTEWDARQNCTSGIWTKTNSNNQPGMTDVQGQTIFHTAYVYYGDK
ncbi:hypothetical protein L9H26_05840 [Morganella psychrotolerans]|uniref:YD repeat-containing protein n=1 Tax=Morganella psychrotolerans TaxID=368603 RepID=A0A5M9R848_9GAMM|nr:hypothetical protein [Morganella psychrotolerans]KAA8717134.1 hypothetical protein F4V73_04515 [Morganella psychrotolerans]OBU08561.1 hypothetical protein AYY16_04520 [Morganella psychrotolerans]